MFFHSYQLTVNPKYLSKASVSIYNSSGISRLNFTAANNVEFIKASAFIALRGKTDEARKEFDLVYLRCSMESCNVSKANFLVKIILEAFEKNSNLTLRCPMKPNFYYGSNLSVDFSYIPRFLIGKMKSWEMTGIMRAKILNDSSMVNLGVVKVTGVITA